MTQSVTQIITAYANLAYATALSTPAGGVPECSFQPLTTNATGHSASPTHCWDNGWKDDDINGLFDADPSKFVVTRFSNRNAFAALAAYSPTLYPWLGA